MEKKKLNNLTEQERLSMECAYVKNHPIRSAEELPKEFKWNRIDEEWEKSLKRSNPFWYTGFNGKLEDELPASSKKSEKDIKHIKDILSLRDRLLTFGGSQAVMPTLEEDLENIILRGQFWYGDRVTRRKGEPNRCHENSIYLWDANRDKLRFATGYALAEDGGWRQHSWNIFVKPRSNKVVETTVKWVAYFGFVMDETESQLFFMNY